MAIPLNSWSQLLSKWQALLGFFIGGGTLAIIYATWSYKHATWVPHPHFRVKVYGGCGKREHGRYGQHYTRTKSDCLQNSISTGFSLGPPWTVCNSKFKVGKILGHKYYFVPIRTQPGQRPKNQDCPGKIGTLGNYANLTSLGLITQVLQV